MIAVLDRNDLYRKSLMNSRLTSGPGNNVVRQRSQQPKRFGLSPRAYAVLRRAGLVEGDSISPEKILQEVESGKIWLRRNVGQKTVRELCQWLSESFATVPQ
jgi:hypothetical protein